MSTSAVKRSRKSSFAADFQNLRVSSEQRTGNPQSLEPRPCVDKYGYTTVGSNRGPTKSAAAFSRSLSQRSGSHTAPNNIASVKPAGTGLTAANLKLVSSSRQRSSMAVPKLGTVVSGEACVYPSTHERVGPTPGVTPYPNPSQVLSATAANSGNDNRPRKLPRDMFFVGGIIRACLHEQDFGAQPGPTNRTMNSNITGSRFGTIHTKVRKMVIISVHLENYIAIPLYSHNGKGLRHKRNPDEFVSVFDYRNPGPFVPLSGRGALMTKYIAPTIHAYDPRSTAKLTYPVSRSYSLPVVYEGYLDTASTAHLISLYAQYAPKTATKKA